MSNHFAHIVRMHCIENCEEVSTIRQSISRICILEELHHLCVVFELWVHIFHRKFVIHRYIDEFAGRLWEQRLFPFQNLTQEISVDCCGRRHKELDYSKLMRN